MVERLPRQQDVVAALAGARRWRRQRDRSLAGDGERGRAPLTVGIELLVHRADAPHAPSIVPWGELGSCSDVAPVNATQPACSAP